MDVFFKFKVSYNICLDLLILDLRDFSAREKFAWKASLVGANIKSGYKAHTHTHTQGGEGKRLRAK